MNPKGTAPTKESLPISSVVAPVLAPVRRTRIAGVGLGIPSHVLTNEELSKVVDTSDEWIRTRTGIVERRVVDRAKGETNSSLAIAGSKQALMDAGVDAQEIDLVICCTATPDTWMPITAARIADGLGIKKCASFDLNAACSGFLTGLTVADSMIRGGSFHRALVVGSDVFSSIIDWSDRKTCVLFGDGAGAAVVTALENGDPLKDSMILESQLFTMPDREEYLAVKNGGSRDVGGAGFGTARVENAEGQPLQPRPVISMNGSEVFKAGSRGMAEAAQVVMKKANVKASDIRWLVPHQANLRIIEMVAKLCDFPIDKVYVNVDRWGNTSAATVAIALAEMREKGLLKRGDLIMLDAFGGGFTYGAMLLRW